MNDDYFYDSNSKLKLILLCHSATVEAHKSQYNRTKYNSKEDEDEDEDEEQSYEDEYGKCSTFSKIIISPNDRIVILKKIVEKKFGICPEDQILIYKDKVLKSDLKPLSHHNIKQFAKIHIFDERDINNDDNELTNNDSPQNVKVTEGNLIDLEDNTTIYSNEDESFYNINDNNDRQCDDIYDIYQDHHQHELNPIYTLNDNYNRKRTFKNRKDDEHDYSSTSSQMNSKRNNFIYDHHNQSN
jgi:hypothetical protein